MGKRSVPRSWTQPAGRGSPVTDPKGLPALFDVMPGVRRPTTGPVARIHEPRIRNLLPRGFGGECPGPGYIGLNVPRSSRAAALALGAGHDEYQRFFVARSQAVDPKWQPYLPLIARKHFKPLCVDMIPESSFGASLKNLLTDSSWNEIRRSSYHASGTVCLCCGEGSGALQCHEVWDFDDQPAGDGWQTQRLKGLLAVCGPCHMMFQPGLANIRGLSEDIQNRLRTINVWSSDEYNQHAQHGNRMHAIRSRVSWRLDFSDFKLPELEIDPQWQQVDDAGTFSRTLPIGRCVTRITGVAYRYKGKPRIPGESPETRGFDTIMRPGV